MWLASLVAIAAIVISRRVVEVEAMEERSLEDGGTLEVWRLEGPSGTPEGELRRRDASGEIVWRVPIVRGVWDASTALADELALLRADETLTAIDIASGAVRWSQPDPYRLRGVPELGLHVFDGFAVEALRSVAGPESLYRRRSLATGAPAWETPAPPLREGERGELRRFRGELFVDLARNVYRLDLEDGSWAPLAPESATAICVTAEGSVVHRERGGALVVRRDGGPPQTVGRVPQGELSCARDGERTWIVWSSGERGGSESPRAVVRPLASGEVGEDARGALLVVVEDGSLAWAIATGWGAPELGIAPPADARPTWSVPRAAEGRLRLRVIEPDEFLGEEAGEIAGREDEIVLDEATGAVL